MANANQSNIPFQLAYSNDRGNTFFYKGVKRVSKCEFLKFQGLEALIYKGLRYSDSPTTNQKVVGSNPAGLTNGNATLYGWRFSLV